MSVFCSCWDWTLTSTWTFTHRFRSQKGLGQRQVCSLPGGPCALEADPLTEHICYLGGSCSAGGSQTVWGSECQCENTGPPVGGNDARGNQEASGQDRTGEAENRTVSDSRHGRRRLAQAECTRQWLLPSQAILNRAPGPELSQGEEFESIFSSTLLPSGGGAKEKDLSLLVMRFTIPWGPLPQTDTLWLV